MSLINPKGKSEHLANISIRSEAVEGGGSIPDDECQLDFVITNGDEDSYGSRMTEKTMRNYEEDINAGIIPFMLDHGSDTSKQIGRFIKAEYDESANRVIATASMLRDTPATPPDLRIDEYIRRIERKFYTGASVGFRDADEICNIKGCEKPIFDYDRSDPCEHVPKRYYNGERCTYSVDNARLREVSLVPQPSNTGAGLYDTRQWEEDLRKVKTHGDVGSGDPADKQSLLERDGLKYRESLIAQAIKMGIRAEDGFDEQLWRKRFADNDSGFIIDQTKTWTELGDQRWGKGGRVTEPSAPQSQSKPLILPSYLFEVN